MLPHSTLTQAMDLLTLHRQCGFWVICHQSDLSAHWTALKAAAGSFLLTESSWNPCCSAHMAARSALLPQPIPCRADPLRHRVPLDVHQLTSQSVLFPDMAAKSTVTTEGLDWSLMSLARYSIFLLYAKNT